MLKSILFAVATLVLSSFAVTQTAQASPIITQEFLFEDGSSFGFVSINTADIEEDGFALRWEAFELFGFVIDQADVFGARFDFEDFFTGLNYLQFDVRDLNDIFAFSGVFVGDFGQGYFSIFTDDGEFLFDDYFVMGAPVVSGVTVPAPGTLFLMMAGFGGLLLRRRS